ncbi:hypothetical protein J2W55_001932 [Mucilaginibacter pocheonensis]|uniref:Uncharacterized protein n=1 Tax=Mucilaginibacter pocheonensis TaxID=398050 RepID=A0ABU1TB54_9SPHI|nr:hypothetical protein [Mucilaginibacter pocheonensis]
MRQCLGAFFTLAFPNKIIYLIESKILTANICVKPFISA